MKKNLSDYVVATAVIVCSVVLLAALTIALTGWHTAGHDRTVDVFFRDVTGIRVHSEVRYAGAHAGYVSAVQLLSATERENADTNEKKRNAVRVTLLLDNGVPPIPADTRVSLSSDTLLGEKFVALSAGTTDVPKLANGALLQGNGSGSLDTLIESIGPLVESITPLVDSLRPLVRTADEALHGVDPILKKSAETIDTLRLDTLPKLGKVSETADAALKRVDTLLSEADGPIKADLEQLKVSLVQVKETLATADGFLNHTDKNLGSRMTELGVVLQNLKVAATYAKAITQSLGEKPNRLIFSGKPQTLTPEGDILRSDKVLPAVKQ